MDDVTIRPATVVALETGRIRVRVECDDEDCGGCRSCAMKSVCKGRGDGRMELAVPLRDGTVAVEVGTRVTVAYRLPGQALAATVMFVPPLAGLLAGGALAAWLTAGGDVQLVAMCLAGAGAGVLATFLLSRFWSMMRPVVRLVPIGEAKDSS